MEYRSSDVLKNAVKVGWYNKVERLGNGIDGRNYFIYAVNTNIQTVKALLKKDMIIDSSVLFQVIKRKSSPEKTKMVEYLLGSLGLDPNIEDRHGDSILFSIKDVDTLKLFEKHRGQLSITNRYNRSLLMENIITHNEDIVKYLLDYEHVTEYIDYKGKNFLHYVFGDRKYYYFINSIENYLHSMDNIGKLLNQKDNNGYIPFSYFFDRELIYSYERETIYYMLNYHNLKINIYSPNGMYIFSSIKLLWKNDPIIETRKTIIDILKILLDQGLNFYERDEGGKLLVDKDDIPPYIQDFLDEYFSLDIKEPDM